MSVPQTLHRNHVTYSSKVCYDRSQILRILGPKSLLMEIDGDSPKIFHGDYYRCTKFLFHYFELYGSFTLSTDFHTECCVSICIFVPRRTLCIFRSSCKFGSSGANAVHLNSQPRFGSLYEKRVRINDRRSSFVRLTSTLGESYPLVKVAKSFPARLQGTGTVATETSQMRPLPSGHAHAARVYTGERADVHTRLTAAVHQPVLTYASTCTSD